MVLSDPTASWLSRVGAAGASAESMLSPQEELLKVSPGTVGGNSGYQSWRRNRETSPLLFKLLVKNEESSRFQRSLCITPSTLLTAKGRGNVASGPNAACDTCWPRGRLEGALYSAKERQRSPGEAGKKPHRVVCLGKSHGPTAGSCPDLRHWEEEPRESLRRLWLSPSLFKTE